MDYLLPNEPDDADEPTPEQWRVLAWAYVAVAVISIGLVGLKWVLS